MEASPGEVQRRECKRRAVESSFTAGRQRQSKRSFAVTRSRCRSTEPDARPASTCRARERNSKAPTGHSQNMLALTCRPDLPRALPATPRRWCIPESLRPYSPGAIGALRQRPFQDEEPSVRCAGVPPPRNNADLQATTVGSGATARQQSWEIELSSRMHHGFSKPRSVGSTPHSQPGPWPAVPRITGVLGFARGRAGAPASPMSRTSSGGVNAGLAAQLDAVEHAAGLLVSRSHACFDERLGFDFTGAVMMPHHESRPIWVTSTGRVFLEAFSPLYEQARDFLVAICEPKSRPEFIHEYALDRHALFAAASMGLTGTLICDALQRFSKCQVAQGVQAFVRACTSGYGKVKLVLHRSRFYVESPYSALLRSLASDPVVRECRVLASAAGAASAAVDKDGFLVGVELAEGVDSVGLAGVVSAAPARPAGGQGSVAFAVGASAAERARVSARLSGEVDELEEDSREVPRPVASHSSQPTSGLKAAPSAEAMAQLSDEELLAFIDRMDPVLGFPTAHAEGGKCGVVPRPKRLLEGAASAQPGAPKRPDSERSPRPSATPDALTHGMTAEQRGQVLRFEIRADKVDVVRARCARMHPPIPLMLEYDFREDRVGVPSLAIELSRPEGLRPYQSRSLAKMFGNGRARSGMIVLPCGAGKTLVGIAAAATIKKSTIVLCPNETSINQWEEAFKGFTTLGRTPRSVIRRLTRGAKEPLPPASEAVILLTTYSMIGMRANAKAAAETVARLREIEMREWGLMILDETHQVVAETFRQVLYLSAHCRLGLTATVRRATRTRCKRQFSCTLASDTCWFN